MDKQEMRAFRWCLLLLASLSGAGMYHFHVLIHSEGWFDVSLKLRATEIFGWLVIGILIVLGIWKRQSNRIIQWAKAEYTGPSVLRWFALLMILVFVFVYPVLMYGELRMYFFLNWTRQMIFVWLVVLASAAMAVLRRKSWWEMVPFAAALLAVSYHFATYIPDVSNYPFALGWSETTRYYVASTIFDQRIYGMDLPLPFRDFSRYIMQAVPFLLEDSPLWLHRLWQAALRFSSTYFAGYMIAKHYKIKGPRWIALFSMWAGLYFFQGPVFYNLIVIVILVFWLVKPNHFWKALISVAGISVWAGLSRVNWIPMPGLMAAVFFLMEKPVEGKNFKAVARYLWQPAILIFTGTIVGFAAYQGYAVISGNPEEIYYASFTSYLLWDRLLPNPSFKFGILPYIMLLTAPLLTYLWLAWDTWKGQWHIIRSWGLIGIIGVLFAGGLLVSVKIGGGTNLHNMDVYLVILLLIAAEVYFNRTVDSERILLRLTTPEWLRAIIFTVPILYVISYGGGQIPERDMVQAQKEIISLQEMIDQAASDDGEILLISQRHLITFDYLKNVSLVHDHEKLLLQEMAMSQNEQYLENLGNELAEQRYALIVHDPLPRRFKDPKIEPLAEENNVVLEEVSPLFFCAYREKKRMRGGGFSILIPEDNNTCNIFEE